jgi:hypothetical protein
VKLWFVLLLSRAIRIICYLLSVMSLLSVLLYVMIFLLLWSHRCFSILLSYHMYFLSTHTDMTIFDVSFMNLIVTDF